MNGPKFILAIVIIGLPGFAYTAEPGTMGAAMQGEGHMGDPLHRQLMNVFLLPEMQPELGLSVQQVGQLRELKRGLLAKSKDIGAQLAERRKELDQLLSGDTSRTRAVKALFEKIGDLRAQLQYAGFETSNKMKAVLSDEQRTKLNAMKPADLHRLMMSRTNMGEMEQAMQLMAAEDGMQKGMGMSGMKQGSGMMQGMSGSNGDMTHSPSDSPHEHSH